MRGSVAIALLVLVVAATPAQAAAPRGTWTMTVPSSADRGGLTVSGEWRLELGPDGYLLVPGGDDVASGVPQPFRLRGTTATFRERVEREDPGCSRSGTYRLKRPGKALRFTRIKDACDYRRAVLTAGTWRKR